MCKAGPARARRKSSWADRHVTASRLGVGAPNLSTSTALRGDGVTRTCTMLNFSLYYLALPPLRRLGQSLWQPAGGNRHISSSESFLSGGRRQATALSIALQHNSCVATVATQFFFSQWPLFRDLDSLGSQRPVRGRVLVVRSYSDCSFSRSGTAGPSCCVLSRAVFSSLERRGQ